MLISHVFICMIHCAHSWHTYLELHVIAIMRVLRAVVIPVNGHRYPAGRLSLVQSLMHRQIRDKNVYLT